MYTGLYINIKVSSGAEFCWSCFTVRLSSPCLLHSTHSLFQLIRSCDASDVPRHTPTDYPKPGDTKRGLGCNPASLNRAQHLRLPKTCHTSTILDRSCRPDDDGLGLASKHKIETFDRDAHDTNAGKHMDKAGFCTQLEIVYLSERACGR